MADRTVLRAPFAGGVTAKLPNVGDTAMPGQTLRTVEAPGTLRFEARVPDTRRDELTVGTALPVRLDGPDRDIDGRIAVPSPIRSLATSRQAGSLTLAP